MRDGIVFENEAHLVELFCGEVKKHNENRNRRSQGWIAYHETAGWDLLLVGDRDGAQIGIEAKMSLNAKVLEQALKGGFGTKGPDYRAVLVPRIGLQLHLKNIADHIGITIIELSTWGRRPDQVHSNPSLPDEDSSYHLADWHNWCPFERETVPPYIPDVSGGKASPVTLSQWKIKAIKLVVLLDRQSFVTRADMRKLAISPSMWTARGGFLVPGENGYVKCEKTPDFRKQHPTNYLEIEADFETWWPKESA